MPGALTAPKSQWPETIEVYFLLSLEPSGVCGGGSLLHIVTQASGPLVARGSCTAETSESSAEPVTPEARKRWQMEDGDMGGELRSGSGAPSVTPSAHRNEVGRRGSGAQRPWFLLHFYLKNELEVKS